MTPGEYLESIKHRLITDNSVSRYEIIREQFTALLPGEPMSLVKVLDQIATRIST